MELKDLLRQKRLEKGLTLKDVADFSNVNVSTISRYERGEIASMKTSTIQALSKLLDIPIRKFIELPNDKYDFIEEVDSNNSRDNIEETAANFNEPIYSYPLYGDIACGKPIYADDRLQGYVKTEIKIKADFCIRAHGDSMIGDRICDGDLVFIKSQPTVENGEIAAVLIGNEATLKRVMYDQDAGILRLFPSNPDSKNYPIQTYSGEELNQIRIMGKAVKCQFDLNV